MGGEVNELMQRFDVAEKSTSDFVVRLAELIALVAVFEAASDISESSIIGVFSFGLQFVMGLHFAQIYKPVWLVLDKIAGDLSKKVKAVIGTVVFLAFLPVIFLTSYELTKVVKAIAVVSGATS